MVSDTAHLTHPYLTHLYLAHLYLTHLSDTKHLTQSIWRINHTHLYLTHTFLTHLFNSPVWQLISHNVSVSHIPQLSDTAIVHLYLTHLYLTHLSDAKHLTQSIWHLDLTQHIWHNISDTLSGTLIWHASFGQTYLTPLSDTAIWQRFDKFIWRSLSDTPIWHAYLTRSLWHNLSDLFTAETPIRHFFSDTPIWHSHTYLTQLSDTPIWFTLYDLELLIEVPRNMCHIDESPP